MLRLTQKEQVLGERLESACQENTELRANLASLHARLARHDQLNQQRAQQVLAMQIHDPVVLKRARPPCKTWRVGARVNEQASVATGKFRLCFGATGFQSCFLSFILGQRPGIWHFRMFSSTLKSTFHAIAAWQLFKQQHQISLRLRLLSFRSSHLVRRPVWFFSARAGVAGSGSRKESRAAAAG